MVILSYLAIFFGAYTLGTVLWMFMLMMADNYQANPMTWPFDLVMFIGRILYAIVAWPTSKAFKSYKESKIPPSPTDLLIDTLCILMIQHYEKIERSCWEHKGIEVIYQQISSVNSYQREFKVESIKCRGMGEITTFTPIQSKKLIESFNTAKSLLHERAKMNETAKKENIAIDMIESLMEAKPAPKKQKADIQYGYKRPISPGTFRGKKIVDVDSAFLVLEDGSLIERHTWKRQHSV